MLQNTFCHTQGISINTEKKIWENNIKSWDEFLEKSHKITSLTQSQITKIKQEILFSKTAFEQNNLNYFKEKIPSNQHWRCVNCGKIAFVDIETTGLSKYTNKITTIGIYDGKTPKVYIRNQDLNQAIDKLKEFDIIVTFNGKTFDIPFIEEHFKEKLNCIHLDLRYLLKEYNLSGGLKNIELELGISRPEEVANMNGYEAVKLWKKYENQNDISALEKLIKYNIEDIINLKTLLDWYLEKKLNELNFSL